MSDKTFVQEVEVLEVVRNVGKENKRFQAIFLQRLEELMGKDTPEYVEARKFFLDESSNFTRAVVREIFGEIDYFIT